MPPKKGIVKSGNAGNSSKSAKATDATGPESVVDRPLFPPGSKYPLSLLHERCQKEGWEKPAVDTPDTPRKRRIFLCCNPHKDQQEVLRTRDPRHWGATYALYRFCNGIQLHRVLPPGPRDYWNELAAEHKAAPEHQRWMYAPDPFAALQEVKERQAKAAQRRETESDQSGMLPSSGSNPYDSSPEVRMAASLREEVEEAVKEGLALYSDNTQIIPDEGALLDISKQLRTLGFTDTQAKKAAMFLSQPSSLLSKLLETLSPLEAIVEYLLLYTPECDLPPRFLPAVNSSSSFVSSVHSGTSNVKKRWIEDKAVKEAGWPIHVVQEYTSDPDILNDWPLLMVKLGKRLLGTEHGEEDHKATSFSLDEDELQALGAERTEDNYFVLPSFTAPLVLHIFFDASRHYPRPYYAPMFITSDKVPPYVRLHILSRILSSLYRIPAPEESEETFGMMVMRIMDEEWAHIEDQGPPNISTVMTHMLPERKAKIDASTLTKSELEIQTTPRKQGVRKAIQNPMKREGKNIPGIIIETRRRLPAFRERANFLTMLSRNRVVVVVGETGKQWKDYTMCFAFNLPAMGHDLIYECTVPQYILESAEESEVPLQYPYIIVTQPRRISAISVANRVSEERGDDGTVGFSVRGKSKHGIHTRLLFCTTGVVLRRLSNGDKLENVSHIVVDEVHERTLDGDFLLLALKELLRTHPTLKIILMSATINHEVFAQYFNGAPVLSIPGVTHTVTNRYLEDVVPTIGYLTASLVQSEPIQDKQMQKINRLRINYGDHLNDKEVMTISSIVNSKIIDYQLISSLVAHIVQNHERAGILIFLPGINEIRQCIDAVNSRLGPKVADTFPLHANLPIEEQNRVFHKSARWKVIAATNVAETSITIDDIVYVIDAGKVKETRYMPETDLTCLEETLISKAAARQRRGRAGRVRPGICYKLYTKHMEETMMEEFPKPEILRVPLEQVSLSAKRINEDGDVKELLRQVIDPPDSSTVDQAWKSLQELGAIDSQDKLTPLGRHMAMLPLDVRLAKMLILGTIFQCLDPILSIAALLSSKPLFSSFAENRDEVSRARRKFMTENSDLLTDLEAFGQCQKLRAQGKNPKSFCKENFLSMTTLQEVLTLRREFCAALEECGFIPAQCDPTDPMMNRNSDKPNLLKAIVLGGLWPRVARIHLPKSAIKFDKIQAGTIQRDNTAKEFKMYDLKEGRVFVHPGSVLFEYAAWKSPFLVYFHKYRSSKVFVRDATEVPIYALLLFGGLVSVDYVKGGLAIGNRESFIKLKAWPRIGVLVNQLRQLLDVLLINCVENGSNLGETQNHPVIRAMLALLAHDGMSE